jgi:alpha-L-rhamnosidase
VPARLGRRFTVGRWEKPAIRAEANGSHAGDVFMTPWGRAKWSLGFQAPERIQAYAAPPIRVTQELPDPGIVLEPKPGVYIFDLGQNIAGSRAAARSRGPAGTRLQLRFGEMLHPDGRLMTENLRRARATDFYTLRGDPGGETWQPRFTYHGFQYVE